MLEGFQWILSMVCYFQFPQPLYLESDSLLGSISPVNEEYSTYSEDSITSQAIAQNRIDTSPHTPNSNALTSNCELESPSKWLPRSTSSFDTFLPPEAEFSPDTNNTSTVSSKEPPDEIKAVNTEGILKTIDLQENTTPEDSGLRTHPVSIPSHESPKLDIRAKKARPPPPASDTISSLEQEILEFEILCSAIQALPETSTATSPYQNFI